MKTIELISVPVTDQQRSKEFYLNMGLKLVREAPFGKDQHWIQLSFPESGTNVTLVTWFANMPAGCLQGMTISCDNIESEIEKLRTKGIETGKVDNTPWGKFASIKDPDGNTWSLHQQ
jgi:catechol 2,3-dioxygenase-like lactoylglutathione lyase family enzyme